jgi:hypothetical protein
MMSNAISVFHSSYLAAWQAGRSSGWPYEIVKHDNWWFECVIQPA